MPGGVALTEAQVARIIEMRECGALLREIASELGLSVPTVSQRLARHGWKAKLLEIEVEPVAAAYCGGLFDGEGHICINYHLCKGNPVYELKVTISNTCQEALEVVRTRIGVGSIQRINSPSRRPHWRIGFSLDISGQRAAAFLRVIEPYVIVKRTQVAVALEYADDCMLRSVHTRLHQTPAELALRESYRLRLQSERRQIFATAHALPFEGQLQLRIA